MEAAWIEAVGSMLAAGGAAWAAYEARKAADSAKRTAEAQMIADLSFRYATPEMLDAMHLVRDWCSQRGPGFAVAFREQLNSEPGGVKDLNAARRVVSHYFQIVFRMSRTELLTETQVRRVVDNGQVVFLRGFIEPLEAAGDVDYDREGFDYFGGLWNVSSKVPAL